MKSGRTLTMFDRAGPMLAKSLSPSADVTDRGQDAPSPDLPPVAVAATLGVCMLDTALDARMGSRFHTTSERTRAIVSWLRSVTCALAAANDSLAEGGLGLVICQNVYAQDSRTDLFNLLAGELVCQCVLPTSMILSLSLSLGICENTQKRARAPNHDGHTRSRAYTHVQIHMHTHVIQGFRHVVTQVGRKSLMSRDSGLLIASRYAMPSVTYPCRACVFPGTRVKMFVWTC